MTEREFAEQVVESLQDAGYQALWAGGCVRDELLGLTPNDYDVATDAQPQQVRRLFQRTIAVGLSFGVVEVLGPQTDGGLLKIQVATFRSDGSYSDGRHPDSVVFSSPREDALRRDFTINGMFFDPRKKQLHDFVGGQQDLQDRVLRAIGDPRIRFDEDKLRLLRAVRMATRFDLAIEPETAAAIRQMAGQITIVSAERIAEELRQLIVHPKRVRGLRLLHELGLIQAILPELFASSDRSDDSWDHTLRVMDQLGPQPNFPLALAALLHEISGEPDTAHAVEGIADRLRLSNAEKELTLWLVRNQDLLCAPQALRTSSLKRTLVQPHIRELLALHRADALARGKEVAHVEFCERLLCAWTQHDINPPPLLTGDDLKEMGLQPGPQFKRLLDAVRDEQLDGTITTGAQARDLIAKMVQKGA